MSFLSIILFIVGLGVLVTIHELGHFTMAKIFNVYVGEFSVGFGPKLFSKRVKETSYSLRAIPLGGYVSMFGEGIEVEDGSVPQERSLLGIKKWKRAIIMIAGVTLNAVMAFWLFVGYFSSTTVLDTRYNQLFLNSSEEQLNVLINPDAGSATRKDSQGNDITFGLSYNIIQIDMDGIIDGKKVELSTPFVINNGMDLNKAFNHLYTDDNIHKSEFYPKTKDDSVTITFVVDTGNNEKKSSSVTLLVTESNGELTYNYVDLFIFRGRRLGFFQILGQSFKETGENALLIFKTLGRLFVDREVFENVGGPVAIFKASSMALQSGVGPYLRLWGIISINLAVINLLPFPGLDGWHLFVVAIEGITRKEIPEKVKNIVSTIGLVLLFSFMIFITARDIIGLF